MAIANVIEFGGVSSDAYDVVIEGPGEYTAPNRAYESISVPGRNGALILDKGYYENIDAEFNAVIQAETQLEFERKVRDFKNAIVSQKGYKRLTEAYHPESYRMAVYKSGFDDEPKFIGKAAVFTLVFECKPQRYLMSGETPMEITSGENILNPTLFDASPLLEVKGHGNINVNGYDISLVDGPIGDILLLDKGGFSSTAFSRLLLNTGDTITLDNAKLSLIFTVNTPSGATITNLPTHSETGATVGYNAELVGDNAVRCDYTFENISTPNGTSLTLNTTATINIAVNYSGGSSGTYTYKYAISLTIRVPNNSDPGTLILNYSRNSGSGLSVSAEKSHGTVIGTSTQSILGNPTYIDCDLGEAYKIENGVPVSLNAYIDLGSNLPVLAVGSSEITFDNTITEVKITPRWWKV